jgi:hypothetical protein
MSHYSRKQVIELLGVDEGFLALLEQEEIVVVEAPSLGYSERMLERARVATNLVRELDVNLAGAAIIVRMREELAELHHRLAELAETLRRDR